MLVGCVVEVETKQSSAKGDLRLSSIWNRPASTFDSRAWVESCDHVLRTVFFPHWISLQRSTHIHQYFTRA